MEAQSSRTLLAAGLAALVLLIPGCSADSEGTKPASPAAPPKPAAPAQPSAPSAQPVTLPQTPGVTTSNDQQQVMEINKAVVVTVEIPGNPTPPTVAQALRDIERRYQPADGQGRTFAILDGYGDPTPDGKSLHLSMHVSSEKAGLGQLVHRPTGQTFWNVRIVPGEGGTQPFTGKDLRITIDDGKGNARYVDGSRNPPSILDATIKDLNTPIRSYWPDGQVRQVTFFYSACGCPVHVEARRTGDRIVRTKELPVIFPDDPAAVAVINRLMQW